MLLDNNSLKKACQNKNLEEFKRVLRFNDVDPNSKDIYGETVLHMVVKEGNMEDFLKELLKHDKTDPNIFNRRGFSVLHEAVEDKRSEYVEIILSDERVNVNLQTEFTKQTALHLTEDEDILEKLLKIPEINPNLQNREKNTPLHLYSFRRHELYDNYFGKTLIPILLKLNNIDTYIRNKDKKTADELAVDSEKDEYGEWEKLPIKEYILEYREKKNKYNDIRPPNFERQYGRGSSL